VPSDLVLERIEVGDQVSAHAVGVDHLKHARFAARGLFASASADECVRSLRPAQRLVRDAEIAEDLVVEVLFPRRSSWIFARNAPDSAPWMIRWS
jgi:hypothetical protein